MWSTGLCFDTFSPHLGPALRMCWLGPKCTWSPGLDEGSHKRRGRALRCSPSILTHPVALPGLPWHASARSGFITHKARSLGTDATGFSQQSDRPVAQPTESTVHTLYHRVPGGQGGAPPLGQASLSFPLTARKPRITYLFGLNLQEGPG